MAHVGDHTVDVDDRQWQREGHLGSVRVDVVASDRDRDISGEAVVERMGPGVRGVLAFIAIGAVVVAVLVGLDGATEDQLETTVGLDEGAALVAAEQAGRYRLDVADATLVIDDPTAAERFAVAAPTVLGVLVVGAVASLLYEVARSVRAGDPFHRSNARRLRWAALITLVGAWQRRSPAG
jgi:hypothetical protein